MAIQTWWRHQMETFCVPLAFAGGIHRWPVDSPHKASDVKLLFFLCAPDQTVEQTVEAPVILSAIMSMWRHYNEIVHWQGHPILVVNVTAYICFNHAVIREPYWWPSHVSMILNSFARIPLAVACARNQYLQSVLRSIIRCVTYIYMHTYNFFDLEGAGNPWVNRPSLCDHYLLGYWATQRLVVVAACWLSKWRS